MDNPEENQTTINSLPIESILHIFQFLLFEDVLKASLISKHWFLASQHSSIVKKTLINITSEDSLKLFLESSRYVKNLEFSYNPAGASESYDLFWTKYSEDLKYVCLNKITNYVQIISGLSKLKNLDTIELIQCNFKIDDLPYEEFKVNISTLILDKRSESPRGSSMSKTQSEHFFQSFPNLRSLKYYCDALYSPQKELGISIVNFLQNPKLTKSLKSLEFCAESLTQSPSFFGSIFEFQHLDLDEFKCHINPFRGVVMDKFLISQSNLKKLQVFCQSAVQLSEVVPKLPKLEYLAMNLYKENTDLNSEDLTKKFQAFWKLKKLEVHFKNWHSTEYYTIFETLVEKTSLESLEIKQCTNMEIFIEKLPLFKNLRCLTIKSCYLTDNLLQQIIKNLTELRELRLLDWTDNLITDFGLTGVPFDLTETSGFSIFRLQHLKVFCLTQYTSLRYGAVKDNERFSQLRLGFVNPDVTNNALVHFSKLRKLKLLCFCFKSKICESGIRDFEETSSAMYCRKSKHFKKHFGYFDDLSEMSNYE